jgi:hypothetical protein
VLVALRILAYSKMSGLNDELDIIKPKYLNSVTVLSSSLFIISLPLQFTYIALVLSVFICKSFSSQNAAKQLNRI